MTATLQQVTVQTLEIAKHEEIAAPIDIVFETILEQMGPLNSVPQRDGSANQPMPMVLEAFPGGRWFRDLGGNAGHFWGVVQAIKPSSLLEISGPLFLSTPAVSNVQYRLTEKDGLTQVHFTHRVMGWFDDALQQGVNVGWTDLLTRIRAAAEKRGSKG